MSEKNCKDCIHFRACCKWTDFPKQCGVPVCAKFEEKNEGEWISVDERLPELEGKEKTWGDIKIQDSVRVLCACRQKSGKTLVKEGFYQLWGNGIKWRIPGSIDAVTHWMPLPQPPKMKGGE